MRSCGYGRAAGPTGIDESRRPRIRRGRPRTRTNGELRKPGKESPPAYVPQVGAEAATLGVCLAERVGFVPDEPAILNDLADMVTTETRDGTTVQFRDDAGTRVPLTIAGDHVAGLQVVLR